jgi:hypothetical protein
MEGESMSLDGYKIVPFIPAGRKRTMSILLDNLQRFRDVVDEVQVWVNCDDDQVEDLQWVRSLETSLGDWVKVIERRKDRPVQNPKQLNTGGFYIHTVDPNAIYFRFDDDIVFIDDKYFENMVEFRLDNPHYFLVMGNIWNNAIISYLHQQVYENLDKDHGIVSEPFCMDMVGWRDPVFATYIHEVLLKKIEDGTVDSLFFDKYELKFAKRFSVSNFCFFGRDFKQFGGELDGAEEETWLTEVKPQSLGRLNAVCGSALVSHYSFFAQRPVLDKTDILERYRAIGQQKLSDSYYRLLGHGTEQEKKADGAGDLHRSRQGVESILAEQPSRKPHNRLSDSR